MASTQLDDFVLASLPLASTSAASPASSSGPSAWLSTVEYVEHPKLNTRVCLTCANQGVNVYDNPSSVAVPAPSESSRFFVAEHLGSPKCSTDQTPLSSITVGPSFRPTTGACSRTASLSTADSIRTKGIRSTWVAVQAPDDDEKGQIWQWTEDERKDGSTEADPSKTIYPVSSRIAGLLAPRTLPNHLLLLTASGSIALATAESMSIVASSSNTSTVPAAPIEQRLLAFPLSATKPSVLPQGLQALLPHRKGAHLVFVIRKFHVGPSDAIAASGSVSQAGKRTFKKAKRPSSTSVIDQATAEGAVLKQAIHEIEVLVLDPEVQVEDEIEAQPRLASLGKVELTGNEVVLSDAGFVTSINAAGQLSSFRLEIRSTNWPLTWTDVFSTPLETAVSLSLVKDVALSPSSIDLPTSKLLALHSSFVCLGAIRPPSTRAVDEAPSVQIVIWDVRLGAVLTSSTIAVPNAVAPNRQVELALALPTSSLATVSLMPREASISSPGRLAVFGLPLSALPSQSVLAAIVGKQSLTSRFVANTLPNGQQAAADTEPARHPRTSAAKLAFLQTSETARAAVLRQLEAILSPDLQEGDVDVQAAEVAFDKFIQSEKARLDEYNLSKLRAATEKEKERRLKALKDKDESKVDSKKYAAAKRRIEELVQEKEAEASDKKQEFSWKEVTGRRIKGVSDVYRYQYYDERKALETEMGKVTRDLSFNKAVSAAKMQQPDLPQTFVTAVLHMCLPAAESISTAVTVAGSGTPFAVRRHPVSIVSYLLDTHLAGDSQVPGGVTRALVEAGDWINVEKALRTMPDIAESATVAALKLVATAVIDPQSVASLPQPCPPLGEFLSAFVESPSTPSVLRTEIARQLTGAESVPILAILDDWLAALLKRGSNLYEDVDEDESRKATKAKRLPVDPFAASRPTSVPTLDKILPLIEAILDAHFINLLLQRQSHELLRSLFKHVQAHVNMIQDLGSLLGALSIYSRARDQQRDESTIKKLSPYLTSNKKNVSSTLKSGRSKLSNSIESIRQQQAQQTALSIRAKYLRMGTNPSLLLGSSSTSTLSALLDRGTSTSTGALNKSMQSRIRAQEKHFDVPEYSVETFYL
ncbi:hypothetical protein OIV83_003508 [Microbotryomycetes sp. JL201]|nr:hypothetical protein OIV83_003508 [Microbotryomycetes sp. JL201]